MKFNEYAGPLGSFRVGFNFMWDYAAFSQDANSEEQISFATNDNSKLRDFRVLFGGRLNFKRQTTWSTGIMYDAANDEWVARTTGIMVAVPEIWGQIFVGRTKEGFSLNKVMLGTAGWGMERAAINDATIPILADGVKWLGYVPKARILWNLGVYADALSEGQGFSTYDNQISGRFAWLPVMSNDGETLLHLGVSGRYGNTNEGKLRLRARPGTYPAPYFIDTGEFAANSTTMTGLEVYYRPGRFTFGSEYFLQSVDAPDSGNPFFHGGEVAVAWMITGETRTYNTRGGYFNAISPARSIYSGGRGAWEARGALRLRRFGQRHALRRQVLEMDPDAELACLGQRHGSRSPTGTARSTASASSARRSSSRHDFSFSCSFQLRYAAARGACAREKPMRLLPSRERLGCACGADRPLRALRGGSRRGLQRRNRSCGRMPCSPLLWLLPGPLARHDP